MSSFFELKINVFFEKTWAIVRCPDHYFVLKRATLIGLLKNWPVKNWPII